MKRYFLFILLLNLTLLSTKVKAQNELVDSLKRIANRVKADSAAKLYIKIANIFTGANADSVRKYAAVAGSIAPENSSARGDVMIQFGNSYHMENKIDSALNHYNKALRYFEKIGNEKGIGKVYQSFSVVKNSLGDLNGAISDSKKAAAIYKKINWSLGLVLVYNNISASYFKAEANDSAIVYSRRAFSASKLLNDSLRYYSMMSNYGSRLSSSKQDSAIYYIQKSTPFLERNGMYNLLIPAYGNLAHALDQKGPVWRNATKSALFKSIDYSILSGATDNLRYVYRDLGLIYIEEGKRDSAKFYVLKTLVVIDSLAQQNGLQMIHDMEAKYETEKKELQIRNQALELDAREQQNRRKTQIIWLVVLALFGSGFFGAVAFVNYRKTRKANLIIEQQKKQVEQKNEEITVQKEIVEEKQKEIIDSINYARRIQQAVLTGENVWNKLSPEHFLLFKPKDIVSGDFYWSYNAPGNHAVFALADCTGHGVPGGFMSMLGNSFLNEIVVENKVLQADEILNKLRVRVIAALGQKGITDQKDGMDISLCVWNKTDNTMQFAGANNPIWLLREGQITEYKADKMPIGSHLETMAPFTCTRIELKKGDTIYMSSDGYADQFGGAKGKKLKYKTLIELLTGFGTVKMDEQKAVLDRVFEEWKRGYEQVDDVSIIGVRV